MMDYLDQHNVQPKPFVRTKSVGGILRTLT